MSAEAPSRPADSLLRLVELEAAAAGAAAPHLTDAVVTAALRRAAELLAGQVNALLAANAADVAAAEDQLDAGALDRLTLDGRRIAGLGEQLLALAGARVGSGAVPVMILCITILRKVMSRQNAAPVLPGRRAKLRP